MGQCRLEGHNRLDLVLLFVMKNLEDSEKGRSLSRGSVDWLQWRIGGRCGKGLGDQYRVRAVSNVEKKAESQSEKE